MDLLPGDGSLEQITSTTLNPDNVIIVIRSDELKELGETTYTLATCDRTKAGIEWPGDKFLEKLIPSLPKVKVNEFSNPELRTKTNIQHRYRDRRKRIQKPVQREIRDNNCTTRRQKPPYKKFRHNRTEKTNDIDPWVCKPWENQAFFSRLNTTMPVRNTPLISNGPFNDFSIQNSNPSRTYVRNINSNICNFPNVSERHAIPSAVPNRPFVNSHREHLNRLPPTNLMSSGSFQMPNRFQNERSDYPGREFSAPTQNVELNASTCTPGSFQMPNRFQNEHSDYPGREFSAPIQNVDLNVPTGTAVPFGEPPIAESFKKQGLLGDHPFSNMPCNRNLAMFPNGVSDQCDPEGNVSTLLTRTEEDVSHQNSFISNANNSSMNKGSYNTGYSRIHRHNYDQYKDGNAASGQKSYAYPQKTNDSFRDANETNFPRFRNSVNPDNYEDQYSDRNSNVAHISPINNKKIPLNKSRGFYKNYQNFKKPSSGGGHFKRSYTETGNDNLHESSYNESQSSNISETSYMNQQPRNSADESLIHISDAAVVYDVEEFENDRCSASATNSTRSYPNQFSRPNNKRYTQNKNPQQTKKQWATNKNANFRPNRVKYNRVGKDFS